MYYLLENQNSIKIVAGCNSRPLKYKLVESYCNNNNIQLVLNREQINLVCKDEGKYCYKLNENKYIVLHCIYHPDSYFRNAYVEKHFLYHLEYACFEKKNNNMIELCNQIRNYKNDNVICDSESDCE